MYVAIFSLIHLLKIGETKSATLVFNIFAC